MKNILSTIKSEPVLFVALVSAILTCVAAFGLALSKEQTGAILLVVNSALAFVVRRKVTPAGK